MSLFPSLLTVTFNGHSDILVTRTITHRLGRRFSIARMEEMDAMLEKVVQGVLPPAMLKAIALNVQAIDPFGRLLNWLAGACLNGSSAVIFFNGSWQGSLVAFFVGFVVAGLWALLAVRFEGVGLLMGPGVSFCAGFLIRVACVLNLLARDCISGTHLASVITFAPGLVLAISSLELASNSIVSGASRLIAALFVAFSIGIGLNMGNELAALFDPVTFSGSNNAICVEVSKWWWGFAFPVAFVSLVILLDAPAKKWLLMSVPAAFAFFSMFGLSFIKLSGRVKLSLLFLFFSSRLSLVAHSFLLLLSTAIVALTIGLLASLYSSIVKSPPSTFIYAGIVFIVPGSLAISVLHQEQVGFGVTSFGFAFLDVAISVAIGLLIASVPRFHRHRREKEGYVGVSSLV